MNKQDLKTGMIVELKDGEYRIVLGGSLMGIAGTGGAYALKWVHDDLTIDGGREPIVAIYDEPHADDDEYIGASAGWFERARIDMILNHTKCIWRKPKPPAIEMTLEQVCEELGKDIKIVKGA